MIEQFEQDKGPFKKKAVMLLLVALVLLIICGLTNYLRAGFVSAQADLYVKSRQKQEWLKNFNFDQYQAVLAKLPRVCKIDELESVQQQRLGLFAKYNLKVVTVANNPDQTAGPGSKTMKFKSATASVTGTWENIMACLNELEHGNLVVVTDLDVTTDHSSGGLLVKFTYRIYYV
jgi:hypothetical protein